MPIYTVEIDGKQYDIDGDRPPSEAEARAAVGAFSQQPTTDTSHAGIGNPNVRAAMQQMDRRSAELRQSAAENPARTGAMIAATGAGGILPSLLRGAAGAGAGLVVNRLANSDSQPLNLGESLRTMATEGGVQGALAGAGRLVTGLGKAAYKGGVALLPKTIKQQNPNIAATGFREGIALSRGGAKKAEELAKQSRQQADAMLADAEQAGAAPIQPREVIRELRPVGKRMKAQAALGKPDDTPGLVQRARTFSTANRGGIPLTRAQTLKREAQDLADSAYKARDRGATFNQMEALTDEAQARGLRKAIESRVPAVGPVNQRTQDLMGVMRGAEHASETGHIISRLGGALGTGALLGTTAGIAPAAAGAVAGSMLTTPGGLTRTGLMLKGGGELGPDVFRLAALLAQLEGAPEP